MTDPGQFQPPSLARKFLLFFLRDELVEEVSGDLEEKFYRCARTSSFRAKVNYWYQVFQYLRPFAIRRSRYFNFYPLMMYRHNLLLSVRNFKRYKSSFFINLTGLAAGIACTMLIYLWVQDEFRMDQFHEKNGRMYKIMSNHKDASGIFTWEAIPGLMMEEIKGSVPEITRATASSGVEELTISANEKYLKAPGQFASESFFQIFSYPLIEGDPATVLASKMNIVLSESLAKNFFGAASNVLGKTVEWDFNGKKVSFVVSGVFSDVPAASSDQFDFVMSFDYFEGDLQTYVNWYNYYAISTVELRADADAAAVGEKLDKILKGKDKEGKVTLFLKPYSEKYLYARYENGVQSGGRIDYVKLFSLIAIFILVIACINFMNLSTARASRRVKEIGVKKALGAGRGSLIAQYFFESMLMSFLSLIVAMVIVYLSLPYFNFLTQKQLVLLPEKDLILTMTGIALVTGLLAGSYPALYLSGFNTMSVLKGKLHTALGELWARQGLVVFQFTLSIILIVSVIVVFKQVEYVRNANLGYNKDNLVYVFQEGATIESKEAFIQELKTLSGVTNAAIGQFKMGRNNSTGGISWPGKTDKDQIQFDEIAAGSDLIETLGVEIVAGRSFSRNFQDEPNSIIFNETAIRMMGIEDPVGKTVMHYTGERKIVGVVKDFNLRSLHQKVEPMFFLYKPDWTLMTFIRIDADQQNEMLEKVEKVFKKFNPGYPFDYRFVDDDYQALYTSEQRVASLSKGFAGFAILISCLGLFGLASFAAERRVKEIGIRKVLGSSEVGIVYLLSQDFLKMVLVAIVIALPFSYLAATSWLNNFQYRISLEWWYFIGSGICALVIAWLTVGLHTIRAARINPAVCLKYE